MLGMFPSTGSAGRRFASLHRVLRGEFPCFSSTIKALRLPAAHPAALRFLRLAVPQRITRWVRSPADECTAGAWSWSPGISSRVSPRKRQDLPSSWGTRLSVCTCSGDAGRTARTRPVHSAAAWPPVYEQRRLPRKVFRRSIAWLSDSLCTLRSAGYPRPTQHSLPAAGQALPDGLSTRMVPLKGFRVGNYISSSFPKLAWRKGRVLGQLCGTVDASFDNTEGRRVTLVTCGGVIDGTHELHRRAVSEIVRLMRRQIGLNRPRVQILCQIARDDRFSGRSVSAE